MNYYWKWSNNCLGSFIITIKLKARKVKTQEIEEKVHPLRKFILQAVAEATGMENKNRATKENPTSRILGLVLEEIFLGISSLGMSTFSFGLRFRVLGLRDYILDFEGVLRWLILRWWLCFLIHFCPLKNVGVKMGDLGRKKLLERRVRLKNLLNIL